MRSFARLTESQIAKARASGGLAGLRGEGEPLPDHPIETTDAATLSAGMRIMAEAGVVPEEFKIKKEIDAAREAYLNATTPKAGKAKMAIISDLELRYNIATEARKNFLR